MKKLMTLFLALFASVSVFAGDYDDQLSLRKKLWMFPADDQYYWFEQVRTPAPEVEKLSRAIFTVGFIGLLWWALPAERPDMYAAGAGIYCTALYLKIKWDLSHKAEMNIQDYPELGRKYSVAISTQGVSQ